MCIRDRHVAVVQRLLEVVVTQAVDLQHHQAGHRVLGQRGALFGKPPLDDALIEQPGVLDSQETGDEHADRGQDNAADDGRQPAVDDQPAAEQVGCDAQHQGIDEETGHEQSDDCLLYTSFHVAIGQQRVLAADLAGMQVARAAFAIGDRRAVRLGGNDETDAFVGNHRLNLSLIHI